MRRLILMSGLLVLVMSGCSIDQWAGGKSAEMGVALPLTGDLANIGMKLKDGFELAKEDFQETNEDLDFKIDYQDTKFDKKEAATIANYYADVAKPKIILGPLGPDSTLVMAPILENKAPEIPLVAMSMCSQAFEDEPNVFCVYPSAERQLEKIVEEIEKRDIKRLALIVGASEPGMRTSDFFEKNIGDRILYKEEVPMGRADFQPIISKLKEKNPDGIYYQVWPPSIFAKKLKDFDLGGIPIFGHIEHDRGELARAPGAFEGHINTGSPPVIGWFQDRFSERYGYSADMYSQIGYDSMMAALNVLKDSPDDLYQGLEDVVLANPALPGFDFSEERRSDDVEIILYHVKDGDFVPLRNED